MRFWDASALLPLCFNQPQTSIMKGLVEEDPSIVAWWGTLVECYSGLARLRREGLLDTTQESRVASLQRLSEVWTEIQPIEEVRRLAVSLVRRHPLRAADALQLAAAHVWVDGRPQGQPFVSLDRRLREAGLREGFQILPASMPGA